MTNGIQQQDILSAIYQNCYDARMCSGLANLVEKEHDVNIVSNQQVFSLGSVDIHLDAMRAATRFQFAA
jgi:hypothetical protein